MIEIIKILNEIKTTSSKNDKQEILKRNESNQELKEVLEFLMNPFIVTGISTKKMNKKLIVTDQLKETFKDISEMMQYLRSNNSGRDSDIEKIQSFANIHGEEEADFIRELATKSLKIGITSKTLNKVFGDDFIPSFDVMLAESFAKKEHKVTSEFIVTEKLDGLRNVLVKENGKVKMFSRQGQPHLGFLQVEKDAEYLPDNMVYDGEFILRNDNGLNSADLYRETMKVARKDGIKKNIVFHVFDVLPLEDFKKGISDIPCKERKRLISEHVTNNEYEMLYIQEVKPIYVGHNKEYISVLLDKAISEGKEGVMINLSDSPYKCKRCTDILKVKKFHEADVKVLDIVEGGGKYEGKLGAILIQFESDGELWTSEIGSGFSDYERELYWNQPELIINNIVTVGYFEISKNQLGGRGLRFGTWKGIIRDDKTEISMH